MTALTPSHQPSRQAGLTLVELLVSMVVGLAVIGAGLSMYTSSGFASRGGSAMTQMGEDASLALGIMRNHVAMAGYSRLVRNPSSGNLVKAYSDLPVFGCRFGVDNTTRGNTLTNVDSAKQQITCDTSATTASDTLFVLYEADQDNTVPTSASNPTDCLGNSTPLIAGAVANYNIAENRFFINGDGALSCLGNGNATPQPLVDNVSQMRVWYGVAQPDPSTGQRGTVASRYLRADQVGDQANSTWQQVVSVRVCLVIRSREPVLDTAAPYIDCNGTSTPTTDRRLYRAFTTTVVLNNRISQN